MGKKDKLKPRLHTGYLKCECGYVTQANVVLFHPLKTRRRLDCACIDTTTVAISAEEGIDALARQQIEAA